jgi:hypothetical protein
LRKIYAAPILALLIVTAALPSVTSAYDPQVRRNHHPTGKVLKNSAPQSAARCILLNSTVGSTNRAFLRCSLLPTDDTFVDDLSPTKNYGDLPVLIVQDVPSIPHYRNYAYLKFDLPGSLPPDLVSTRAKPANGSLRMYVRLMGLSYNASIRVYGALSNDWNESALTWITRPPHDPADYSVRQVTENGTWFAWNVTKPVDLAMGDRHPVSLAVIPSSNDWRNIVWFDSTRQTQTSINTWPTLDLVFPEPFLTVLTQHPHLPIRIGDRTYETDSNGRFVGFLAWGNYVISVPEMIPMSEGVRDSFVGWSDNATQASREIALGNNLTLNVNYRTQYRLDANSPYGTLSGPGWYYENTDADLTINPTAVPAEGILGLIGVRHIFDHWSGDCSLAQPECRLVMNSPRSAIAVWRDDYTITALAAIALITIATLAILVRRRRGRISRKR